MHTIVVTPTPSKREVTRSARNARAHQRGELRIDKNLRVREAG
jgi:hypothetical protein